MVSEHQDYVNELQSRNLPITPLELGETLIAEGFPFARQKSIFPKKEPVSDTKEIEVQKRTAMIALNALTSTTQVLARMAHHGARDQQARGIVLQEEVVSLKASNENLTTYNEQLQYKNKDLSMRLDRERNMVKSYKQNEQQL